MTTTPFKRIMVDGDLNLYVHLEGATCEVMLMSINGVPVDTIVAHAQEQEPESWKMFINALLPSILTACNAPLGNEAVVGIQESDGTTREVKLPCPEDKSIERIAAIKQQYAAIINLARVSGLSSEDISCVFTATMKQLGVSGTSGGDTQAEMMADMAQAMGMGMPGMPMPGMGQPPHPQQCQQQ